MSEQKNTPMPQTELEALYASLGVRHIPPSQTRTEVLNDKTFRMTIQDAKAVTAAQGLAPSLGGAPQGVRLVPGNHKY